VSQPMELGSITSKLKVLVVIFLINISHVDSALADTCSNVNPQGCTDQQLCVYGTVASFDATKMDFGSVSWEDTEHNAGFICEAVKRSLTCNALNENPCAVSRFNLNTTLSMPNLELGVEQRKEIQFILNEKGYNVGAIDGKLGKNSIKQLKKFCQDNDLELPEILNLPFLISLQNSVKDDFRHKILSTKTEFKINNPNALIFDVNKFDYPQCDFFVEVNKNLYPRGFEKIISSFGSIAIPDLLESLPELGITGESQLLADFSISMYKENADCIKENYTRNRTPSGYSCDTILGIVRAFKDRAAAVKTAPYKSKLQYYHTVGNLLLPVTIGYSAVLQRLGKPKDHDDILEWLYAAIIQNTYDVFSPDYRERDLKFDNSKCDLNEHNFAANNHSLLNGYLIALYGVLAEDPIMFNFGFDRLAVTLSSIDRNGALTCEATRGANATYYSGMTITLMLQFLELIHLQDQDFHEMINIDRIHLAAKFLLDVGENPTLIYPYAKANKLAWCSSNYKNQCAGNQGFGWIRHYMKLFPNHPNSARILTFAREMKVSTDMSEQRKKRLSDILRHNFPNADLKTNIYFREDPRFRNADRADLSLFIYDDTHANNRGSPLCLYERRAK